MGMRVIDPARLDGSTVAAIFGADDDINSEVCYQMLHMLITDGFKTGIVNVAPPLAKTLYDDLRMFLTAYYEARKLAHNPLPRAYTLVSTFLLVIQVFFSPVVVAHLA